MTTYSITQNSISVSFDDSKNVISSDFQMMTVLRYLSLDFIKFYCSLPLSEGSQFFFASQIIEQLQLLRGFNDTQFIIDMLRNLILLVKRLNYPEFRIIFVNEI